MCLIGITIKWRETSQCLFSEFGDSLWWFWGCTLCVCCVVGVGDEMFISGQGTGIYAATRAKAVTTVYGDFGGEFSVVECVCVRVWV